MTKKKKSSKLASSAAKTEKKKSPMTASSATVVSGTSSDDHFNDCMAIVLSIGKNFLPSESANDIEMPGEIEKDLALLEKEIMMEIYILTRTQHALTMKMRKGLVRWRKRCNEQKSAPHQSPLSPSKLSCPKPSLFKAPSLGIHEKKLKRLKFPSKIIARSLKLAEVFRDVLIPK